MRSETFISVIIYSPSSLKAENTCKLRGGGTTELPPKEEQNNTLLVIQLLTVAPVANGKQCLSALYLSDLFETFITMKILDKGIEVQE